MTESAASPLTEAQQAFQKLSIPSALSPAQERRLVTYLDAQFLDISRAFNKRSDPSSKLFHLYSYLEAVQHLLPLVLLIPPVYPSASLRTNLLLRLTGDLISAIPAYPLQYTNARPTSDHPPPSMEATLIKLLDLITEVDKGWVAVLHSQSWDAASKKVIGSSSASGAPSQTDKARLNSLILLANESIREWIHNEQDVLDDEQQDQFGGLFWRSLAVLRDAGLENVAADMGDDEDSLIAASHMDDEDDEDLSDELEEVEV